MVHTTAHRHGHRTDPGLVARARGKLADVEARIADLRIIAGTLQQAIDAGCDDLITCADSSHCPLPFTELAIDDSLS